MDSPLGPTMGMNEEMEPESEEMPPDMTQGYSVELYVWPDGTYTVGAPEAVSPEDLQAHQDAEGDDQTDLTGALKRLLNVVKNNPVGGNAEEQFAAGYNAGPGGKSYGRPA